MDIARYDEIPVNNTYCGVYVEVLVTSIARESNHKILKVAHTAVENAFLHLRNLQVSLALTCVYRLLRAISLKKLILFLLHRIALSMLRVE